MIEHFFVRTVTILHPKVVAGYGDATTLDETQPTSEAVMGWLYQRPGRRGGNEEITNSSDRSVASFILRVPADTNISADDQVVIDGTTYSVDGLPASMWSQRGGHHLRVDLRYIS